MTERLVKRVGAEYPPGTCDVKTCSFGNPIVLPDGRVYSFIDRMSRLTGFRERGLTVNGKGSSTGFQAGGSMEYGGGSPVDFLGNGPEYGR